MKTTLAEYIPSAPAVPEPQRTAAPLRLFREAAEAAGITGRLAERARGIRQSPIRGFTREVEVRGGVNLGQGTCPLQPRPEVVEAAYRAMQRGCNSYTSYDGIAELREAVVRRLAAYNRLVVSPGNVVITAGATGAFESVCKAFLEPGDEVIVFEPIYGYHHAQIRERGAVPVPVRLRAPDWGFDAAELERAFTPRTKLFVFSNPNNPTGRVFTREELERIGSLCVRHGVVAVVDEVYEYIVGEGARHLSLASLPGMFEHTLTMGSASKTLFITGWRIGWLVGPESVMTSLGVKFDETYICAPSPFQHAVAHAFDALGDAFFSELAVPFRRKQRQLEEALRTAGLRPYSPEGAYYVLADYAPLGVQGDVAAMHALLERAGVGAVAGNAFFPSERETGLLRFCFAVTDEELDRACELLTTRL